MKNELIYEDENCFITYGPQGVTDGHVKIFSKRPVKKLKDLSLKESYYLFNLAGKIASILYENLQAHGTNIICNDGVLDSAFYISIIPRFNGDNLNLQWEPKQGNREKLDEIENKLKQQTQYLGVKIENEIKEEKENIDPIEKSNESINYLIRQIERKP